MGLMESKALTEDTPVLNIGELSLNEPPDNLETETVKEGWAGSVQESALMSWWNEFVDGQSMRTASLLKTIRPSVDGSNVVITVPPKKTEMLESVKYTFNRFIYEKSEGKLTSLKIVPGDMVETERKPYTDKEKLEFLVEKHPELKDVIEKLGLRLP